MMSCEFRLRPGAALRSGDRRIEEVAERAGVSPITVSRVLRHPEKVNRETRDRILGIIEATGYASNPHARALRSGRSNVVIAFVSNILSQQFGLAVRSFAAALEPEGYEVLVGETSYYLCPRSGDAAVAARHPAGGRAVYGRDRARREPGRPAGAGHSGDRDMGLSA